MDFFVYGKNKLSVEGKVYELLRQGNYEEKIEIPDDSFSENQFLEAISTPNIFTRKMIILVNLDSCSEDLILNYLALLPKKIKDTDVLFYLPKNLTEASKVKKAAQRTKDLKLVEVKEQVDWTIFNFVDAVFNLNRVKSYELLKDMQIKGEEPMKIHGLLVSHLRNLSRVKYGANIKISQIAMNKLIKQAQILSGNDILTIYENFYKIDKNLKLGQISASIVNVLEIEVIQGSNL